MTSVLINIDVPDVAKAEAFYLSALGLKVGRRFGAAGVELLGLPAPIYLLQKDSGTSPSQHTAQTRTYDRHWCPVHLDFVVDDIQTAHERLVKAGAKVEAPIASKSRGQDQHVQRSLWSWDLFD